MKRIPLIALFVVGFACFAQAQTKSISGLATIWLFNEEEMESAVRLDFLPGDCLFLSLTPSPRTSATPSVFDFDFSPRLVVLGSTPAGVVSLGIENLGFIVITPADFEVADWLATDPFPIKSLNGLCASSLSNGRITLIIFPTKESVPQ